MRHNRVRFGRMMRGVSPRDIASDTPEIGDARARADEHSCHVIRDVESASILFCISKQAGDKVKNNTVAKIL